MVVLITGGNDIGTVVDSVIAVVTACDCVGAEICGDFDWFCG